jgi:DNA-binding SARP family transcriptional activator
LRSIVYYLRKTLGERCISYRSGYYKLELEQVYGRAVYYDVERFEHFYAEGREAMEQEEYQLAYSAFQQMVQLYRGDYVQSFYRDWCAARRDALRLAYVDARRQLATITWQDEEYQECIQHWQHILSVDNCNEDAHYGLMCAYIKLGQRNLALRQYQRCVTALREELNVEPRQSIQHLYQRLTRKTTGI